jgi:hypothetical protein
MMVATRVRTASISMPDLSYRRDNGIGSSARVAVAVAREQGVWMRDLELAHVSWAIVFVPPDRVAASTHVHRLRFLDSQCIRTSAQRSCGKPADRVRQPPDGGPGRPADTEPTFANEGEVMQRRHKIRGAVLASGVTCTLAAGKTSSGRAPG